MFNFGSNPGTNTQTSGGLFGQSNTATTSGGLFGQSNNKSTIGGSNVFGQSTSNPESNLMGNTGGLTAQVNAAPQNNTGGLFGQNNNSVNMSSTSAGLFGNSRPANNIGGGGLFGNNASNSGSTGGSLFGAKANSTNTGSGGLFGASSGVNSGLFGNKGTTGQFGASSGNSGGLFGAQNNTAGFQQQQITSALNTISQLPITSMTRIADLPPAVRQEIEQLDQYFQRQVSISHHLKADEEDHLELIQSVPRDVSFLLKTYSITTQSLQQDLKRIQSIKSLTDDNIRDSECFSLVLNQLLTPGTKVSSAELNKFFQEKIQLYKQKLDEYFRVLSDIKSAVQGLDNDMFGTQDKSHGEYTDPIKTGINSIIVTVMEEFELFMDIAERVAQLHQRVKELNGSGKNAIMSS